MIVDIGGGTSDIAVISLGGPVVSASIKVAGDDFDEAIVRFMRKKHNLLIGERTAEEIKIKIGTCFRRPENITLDIRGRNLSPGSLMLASMVRQKKRCVSLHPRSVKPFIPFWNGHLLSWQQTLQTEVSY